jgi:hypothetical protein
MEWSRTCTTYRKHTGGARASFSSPNPALLLHECNSFSFAVLV